MMSNIRVIQAELGAQNLFKVRDNRRQIDKVQIGLSPLQQFKKTVRTRITLDGRLDLLIENGV